MIIGGIQKTTLIDYPGKVAAIVFTRGCPLRCHYCHNPALVLPERYAEQIPTEKVMSFLESRKGKLDGVAVTGGEPTMQADLPEFLKRISGMGFQIKLDTCGVNPQMLEKLIKSGLLDYVAMDLKAPFGRYKEVAGVPIKEEFIRRSIGIIMGSGLDYEFRTTIVKGQLAESDIVEMAGSIEGAKMYALQRFRGGDTLDPKFGKMEAYTVEEMERIREKAGKHVEACIVR